MFVEGEFILQEFVFHEFVDQVKELFWLQEFVVQLFVDQVEIVQEFVVQEFVEPVFELPVQEFWLFLKILNSFSLKIFLSDFLEIFIFKTVSFSTISIVFGLQFSSTKLPDT